MGPFKCPDCGTWWAGFQHRCPPVIAATGTTVVIKTDDTKTNAYTVRCNCPTIRGVNTLPCPIHDVQASYT